MRYGAHHRTIVFYIMVKSADGNNTNEKRRTHGHYGTPNKLTIVATVSVSVLPSLLMSVGFVR